MVGRITKIFKKKEGIVFGNPNGRPKIDISEEHIIYLMNSGKSIREISRILKVSDSTIRRRVKEIYGE